VELEPRLSVTYRGVGGVKPPVSLTYRGGGGVRAPTVTGVPRGLVELEPRLSVTYRGGGGVRAPTVRPQSNINDVKLSEKQSRVTITRDNVQTPQFRLGPHWMSLWRPQT